MAAPTATPLQLAGAVRRLDQRLGNLARWAAPVAIAVPLCLIALILEGAHAGFPSNWVLGVPRWFDNLNNWVTANDESNFFLHSIVGGFGNLLNSATNDVYHFLHWLTWVGVLTISVAVAWLVGTWRTALFSAVMVCSFGVLQIPNGGVNGISQMWPSAMTTLALMAVAIALSTIVGIPLGVASAIWPAVHKTLRPVLDLMQVLPAFAYLVPIVVLFSIGNPAGIVATFIYAVPPLVRYTELGIRSVPRDVIEAADAFGSTRRQVLRNVQLPLALQAIMLGLNQVIMMALSIVVIASLVGAGGLGDPVLSALQTQEIGEGVVAGFLIVFMAMWLDRTSAALGQRATRASARRRKLTRPQLAALWAALIAVVLVCRYGLGLGDWPAGWGFSLVGDATNALNWVTNSLVGVTTPISSFVTLHLLNPLQRWLDDVPWWLVAAIVGTVGWARGGWRRGLLLVGCVVLLGLMQAPNGYTFQDTVSYNFSAWADAMQTLSLIIVALALDLIIGIPLGIAAYRWRVADQVLRPILDTLQTLPAFVYLIPMVALFGVGNVTGMSASLLYALPAAVRATTLGLRAVQRDVIEAGHAFGSTRWQLLFKVELPIARPYLMLAVNQTILLVMAEVVVAGLVGAGGLGLDVVTGFSRSEVGLGAAAGLAMVLMGIVLDRLSQSSPVRNSTRRSAT
ncbi:MAG TPA: ABC transporter permease subunit [Gaiellaceae bacterium]|nr:ABC transporter permease subunit [Gaiellaceae bacterium]